MGGDFATDGWRDLLMTGQIDASLMHPAARGFSKLFKLVPGDVRCQLCDAPFDGRGGKVSAALGTRPSSFSMQVCGRCELKARGTKTGAHVDVATLFADIRGSTEISRTLGAERYRDLIDRFYAVTTDVLIDEGAIIEQLVGDQVASIFVPGLAGDAYIERTVAAARRLQAAYGATEPSGAWIPVGIGIDAGEAFVGVVGTLGGMTELTVLGDVPNRTGRLAGAAGSGEILVTDTALGEVHHDADSWREVVAKGFDEPIRVGVLAP